MIRKRVFSVLYMFGITLVFTSMVSAVFQINRERIARNQRARLQRIILSVLEIDLPARSGRDTLDALFARRVKVKTVAGRTLYTGLEKDGKTPLGYAFAVEGAGFWGPISGMIAVDARLKQVVGLAFYEHSETPGLGGRITEKWFTDQFIGLPLKPMDSRGDYFRLRRPGEEAAPQTLDAITGATETSSRLQRFLNADLRAFLPRLKQQKRSGKL